MPAQTLWAGRRAKRVRVERRRPGDAADLYDEVGRIWCAIEPLGGVERQAAGDVLAEATHRITARRADVRPSDRLVLAEPRRGRTRVFEIRAVLEGADGSRLAIDAVERIEG